MVPFSKISTFALESRVDFFCLHGVKLTAITDNEKFAISFGYKWVKVKRTWKSFYFQAEIHLYQSEWIVPDKDGII